MTHILMDVAGAVGTITIDRRQRFNSLDAGTARDLRKAGLQMARDSAVRAVCCAARAACSAAAPI